MQTFFQLRQTQLLLVAVWGLLNCRGFPSPSIGSRARRLQWLQHRLDSCGISAWLPCAMWDLPRSGIEPVSPVWAGGFFTTELPEKPSLFLFSMWTLVLHNCLFSFVFDIVAENVKRVFPPALRCALCVQSHPSSVSLGGRI